MLKKTALLAVLGVSLFAPAEAGAADSWDWNKFYSDSPDASDSKSVISSGHTGQSIATGTYEGVTFGNAYYSTNDEVENVKSIGNEGTIESGVTTKHEVIGGRAVYDNGSSASKMTVQANNNKITFKSGSSFEGGDYSETVTTNDMLARYGIHGGHVYYTPQPGEGAGEAVGNEVVIEKGVSLKSKYPTNDWDRYYINITGGWVYLGDDSGLAGGNESTASNNKVKIYDPSIEGDVTVRGGYAYLRPDAAATEKASASATGNEVYFSGKTGNFSFSATVAWAYVNSGGIGNTFATSNGNTGTFIFGDLTPGSITGGYARAADDASACENNLSVTGGKIYDVYNGYAFADKASANGNKAVLTDVVGSTVYGGYASAASCYPYDSKMYVATANNNTVVLNGGTYDYYVYGGMAVAPLDNTCEAVNNRVELRNGTAGAPDFAGTAMLYGGYTRLQSEDGDTITPGTSTGNSLNFYDVKGMKAGNIGYFQILNYEYSEMHAGDVILTLNGTDDEKTTSIANADVNVSVSSLFGEDGQSEFKTGDKVVLLKNENGLDTTGITKKATITATTGVSLKYEVDILASDTELFLTRTDASDPDDSGDKVQPGTKAIAEGAASGLALASESANATMEFLRDFSVSKGTITPFVHTQASSMRHETGSTISMSTVSLMAGLGTGFETGAGTLSAGAFFEYGKGSYTTHNSFSNYNDVDGDGNSWYMGGGILAKMEFVPTGPGHFYLEGSAHMGTVHNEYDSNDLYDANGNVARFDMDSPYYSLHGGIGYVWNITEDHELDIYGRYIWTRVQGTDDTLTTRDKFEYDDMDSNRVRLGVRYAYKGSERFSPYVGAAFEHEFSGSCDSRAYGHSVAAPSFEGSSGMGELGLMMKPSEDMPLSVNLGVQGYVGQKQGVSGNCNIMYEF